MRSFFAAHAWSSRRVNGRGLPVPAAVRLETGGAEDARDGSVVDRVDHGLLGHDLGQTPAVPPREAPPVGGRLGARDALDPRARQGGKVGGRPLRSAS
jgi:hypothetical protein